MTTYAQLVEAKAKLLSELAANERLTVQARAEEKASIVAQIKELMAAHDVRLSDLGVPRSKSARAARPAGASTKPNPLSGKKIAAKYADPILGETWSGRGLQPKWLSTAIAAGCKLEDFKVTT